MILAPTMQLAQQLSLAYDSIRQQSDALETFTEARTDPLTGVGNGRALFLAVLLVGQGPRVLRVEILLERSSKGASGPDDASGSLSSRGP